MAIQAARGLAFLHSASPPILHRDLKSGNLLVGEAWCIKLTDFGLSRVRGYAATMTGQVGTCQWMANEVLAQARYTEAADVFSFGVVLWELVTRECPYAHLPSSVQVAVAVLKDGLRPAVPPGVPSELGILMQTCWSADAWRRPTMASVLHTLEGMQ
jgi:serine/threonine protein kinase